jgi:outer membrane protein assembly factor BamE (lipoprotein component of BamABCDE complex)
MKKLNVLFVTFFLILAFTCANDCLFGYVNDLNGQGNSTWGMSKEQVRGRFSGKTRLNDVAITQGATFLIINYRKGTVTRKKFEFDKNRLYKITLTYSYAGRRIIKTYNDKYKPYTRIENNTYIWIFPSTVITHRQGGNQAVFINKRYAKLAKTQNNIDNLRIGMTTGQVRQLMGTPRATASAVGGVITYRYEAGVVTFQNQKITKIEKLSGVLVQSGAVPAPVQGSIDRVKIGMTPTEVKQIMGEPMTSTALGNLLVWQYNTGAISFKSQKVAKIEKTTNSSTNIKVIKKK